MAKHLEGKVAVVTGGGRGIGREIALALAAEGAKVGVNDLGGGPDGAGASNEPADEVVSLIKKGGSDAIAIYESVATMTGGERIVQAAVSKFGKIDILVHCAGILRDRMLFNMTEEEWDAVVNTHLKGMFAVSKPATILMRQQRSGRIIGFSSASGLYGNAGQVNYAAAKDGIASFIRTVARDMGKYGCTVNGIAPAAMTRLTATVTQSARDARARAGITPVMGEGARTQSRLKPRLDPKEITPFVTYLCTPQAKDINGQLFYVQGGQISLLNSPYAARTMQKMGRWTIDEVASLFPATLGKDIVNAAPPQPAQPK
ncbi:MAG: SDR family NAD(P)-dependent oxidoreductase [Chloroflexi bacterium]|nr:SDR family NAD(P)-dependent oxidoreductase [Chloroflexota bacterium]